MRLVALGLALALAGCAHSPSRQEVLAQIPTASFRLPTVDGQSYGLADRRGRIVVMQFFATYCVPCLAELNQLRALAKRAPGDVELAVVGMDPEGALTLRAFRDSEGLTGVPVLVADAATREGRGPFGRVPELPMTVLIDKTGVVRNAFAGLISDADLDALVAEIR